MSDEREGRNYHTLRETHRQVAEQDEKRQTADREPKSPEARMAELEAELAEKVRLGRITKGDMAYNLRRFDNALNVEANIEVSQRGRDEDAKAHAPGPEKVTEKRSEADRQTEAAITEHEHAGRGEMTETRAARLARLRMITEDLTRGAQENDRSAADRSRDPGGRSR